MLSFEHRFAFKEIRHVLAILLTLSLASCGTGASFNDPLSTDPAAGAEFFESPPREQCKIEHPDPGPHFVGLTLSGGGARAAVFSAAVIFELAALDLMDEVDVISGASGGALTAAYYAVTCDDNDQDGCTTSLGRQRREWNRDEVLYDRLRRNFLLRSLLWRLEPYHLARTLFTAYDNTEIFAAVLSDNLYDEPGPLGGGIGRDFKFADINPERPFLVINATSATGTTDDDIRRFTFTKWRFDGLNSDLCSFKIGRAVAASSAYPAVFNYSTLSRYRYDVHELQYKNSGYMHLFDAGASDNLAVGGLLESMERILRVGPELGKIDRSTIFVVDAQNGFNLRSSKLSDPRSALDRVIDGNFIDVYDILMEENYGYTVKNLDELLRNRAETRDIFHLALKALRPNWKGYRGAGVFHAGAREGAISDEKREKLLQAVNRIKTNYGLQERDVHCLAASAHVLVYDLRPKLEDVFGKLPEVSEEDRERLREDLDACLSEAKRGTKPLFA